MWFDTHDYILEGYKKEGYISKWRLLRRGIFLDTAPLFILIVGCYDKFNRTKLIERFNAKRESKKFLRHYISLDYKYLLAFLNSLGLENLDLIITPHIFTEFIKHLWEIVDSPTQFKEILEKSFKTMTFLKDMSLAECIDFFKEEDFLNQKIEVGDISIKICVDIKKKENKHPIAVLTADGTFAKKADRKYGLLSIYYEDIWNGTHNLKEIPKELLKEPI